MYIYIYIFHMFMYIVVVWPEVWVNVCIQLHLSCHHHSGRKGALNHSALFQTGGMEVLPPTRPHSQLLGDSSQWFHHPFGSEWRWQLSSLLSLPSYSPFLLVPCEGEVSFLLLVFDRSQSGIADKLSLIRSTFSKSLARRTRLLEFFFFFFLSSSWSLLTGGFYNVLRPVQDSKEIWGTLHVLLCKSWFLGQSTFF